MMHNGCRRAIEPGRQIVDNMAITENDIKTRLAELDTLIRETTQRLPAHSTKPPIMMELLAYEDEYESLLTDLNRIRHKQ